jgi:hypothetical protein
MSSALAYWWSDDVGSTGFTAGYREFCPKTFSTPAPQISISTFSIPLILNATIVFYV